MTEWGQLPLPFEDKPDYKTADFIPAPSNEAALAWLARDDWPDARLAIWGPEGCGKTHLLQIWAQHRGATILQGRGMLDLDALPEAGFLALDDADRIRQPRLLLHLLNIARDRRLRVLLTGRSAPARWSAPLPDLSSRLRAISAVEIAEPDERLLHILLVRALAVRQLEVAPAAQLWLLRHMPRSASGMLDAVRRLDQESLQQHRPITRTFAMRVLGGNLPAAEGLSSDEDSHRENSESVPERSPKL